MCGICGILNFDPGHHVRKTLLVSMRDLMAHRGPDDAGIYLNKNIGLGHRRLSIIDISRGHQPMCNEDETLWIVYNGEIYNYLDLKNHLISKGHVFKTNSDTEVVLHAYEEFGVNCLEKLRGMFAFAIWDERKKQLFAARDRLGIKPFYYTMLSNAFLFSSEIKSMLLDPRVERRVDDEALFYYLNVRYVPGAHTMFKNIWKLQPGHYILVRKNDVKIRPYWKLNEIAMNNNRTGLPYEDEFIDILRDCIEMRLMSEVPLGVFLSGGIDSSIVVALMSKLSNNKIKTFSVGYEKDFGVNEFNYARMVAQKYDTEHYEYPITALEFYDFIPRLVWHMDEPISDPAAIPLFYLSRYAKQHVTVILSGEGADEILAGYYIYKKMLTLEKFRILPRILRENILLNLMERVLRSEKQKNYIALARLPLEQRYKGVSRAFTPQSIQRLYKHNHPYKESLDAIYESYFSDVQEVSALNRMLYVDVKTWLPDDLLMKADKMTMASSQELRVPFLDHRLVEFAFSLPSEKKLSNNSTKYLLRKIAKPLIPKPIIKREKKGFPVPINHWFRGDLNKFSREVLLDPSGACRDFFDPGYISSLLENHTNGRADFSENIWNLLVFEYWHNNFIKPDTFGKHRS
jgi:asparagine synthase (glutamine-hydrolysing)